MRIILGIIVGLVLIGGLVWFMSGDSSTDSSTETQQADEITETTNIESDEQVFTEIDNALEGLE